MGNKGIRCKMRLNTVVGVQYGGVKAFFNCEYDKRLCEEDRSFSKSTPSGQAEFHIDNPAATEQLVIGQSYYVDFTPVPPPVVAPYPDTIPDDLVTKVT